MQIECERCGATADLVRTGHNKSHVTYEANFNVRCHYLLERLKSEGTIELGDLTCPYMEQAMKEAEAPE